MSALVELYVREVSSGNMKIEDVPAGLREKVKAGVEAKKVSEMLVRLYAGEVILEKITIDDVPRGLRDRVSAYLVDMGYIDAQ